jgi:hypothetical protein
VIPIGGKEEVEERRGTGIFVLANNRHYLSIKGPGSELLQKRIYIFSIMDKRDDYLHIYRVVFRIREMEQGQRTKMKDGASLQQNWAGNRSDLRPQGRSKVQTMNRQYKSQYS